MTEVALREHRTTNLPAQVEYAKLLASSGLLPRQYQGNPANVLWAIEYGSMLGLAPMAAITGVHVIEGKPSASAGLISALVRRAGHKLRVTGDANSATCQIVRSDDPDYTFEVTWTLKKNAKGNPNAEEAGLLGKQVWKQYSASMLKSRAITQCARDACEEALFGLHYTAEELGAEVGEDGEIVGEAAPTAPAGDVWQPPEPPKQDAEWLTAASQEAATFATVEDGQKLWQEGEKRQRLGTISGEDAGRLAELIKERHRAIVEAERQAKAEETVDAVVVDDLDPEDPWSARVDEIDGPESAEAAERELAGAGLDEDYAARVLSAIRAKGFSQAVLA